MGEMGRLALQLGTMGTGHPKRPFGKWDLKPHGADLNCTGPTFPIPLCQLWPKYIAPGRETQRFHMHLLMFLLLKLLKQQKHKQMHMNRSLRPVLLMCTFTRALDETLLITVSPTPLCSRAHSVFSLIDYDLLFVHRLLHLNVASSMSNLC